MSRGWGVDYSGEYSSSMARHSTEICVVGKSILPMAFC